MKTYRRYNLFENVPSIGSLTLVIAIVFLSLPTTIFAQKNTFGTWSLVNLKYNLTDKWSVFGEAQIRSVKLYDHFFYYEYKAGINYRLNDVATVSMAMGSYQTYQDGGDFVLPKRNNELRIWPMLVLKQKLGKLTLEHRFRAELRVMDNGYTNRFRYRPSIYYKFGKKKENYQPFQITLNTEFFFSTNRPNFIRSRNIVSVGYRPLKMIQIHMGYLLQYDFSVNSVFSRDFLLVGINYDIPKITSKRNKEEKL